LCGFLQKNGAEKQRHLPNSVRSIQSRIFDRFARMISAVETNRPKGVTRLNIGGKHLSEAVA
jgi:hypothetical protein